MLKSLGVRVGTSATLEAWIEPVFLNEDNKAIRSKDRPDASYCRCVNSQRLSNGKTKGQNNTRNGNKYLGWAFVELAHSIIRHNKTAHRFYQRKRAQRNGALATKALAHKMARACYYVMRDEVPFDQTKLFT
ncbi:transposase [Marinobacter sp.]